MKSNFLKPLQPGQNPRKVFRKPMKRGPAKHIYRSRDVEELLGLSHSGVRKVLGPKIRSLREVAETYHQRKMEKEGLFFPWKSLAEFFGKSEQEICEWGQPIYQYIQDGDRRKRKLVRGALLVSGSFDSLVARIQERVRSGAEARKCEPTRCRCTGSYWDLEGANSSCTSDGAGCGLPGCPSGEDIP